MIKKKKKVAEFLHQTEPNNVYMLILIVCLMSKLKDWETTYEGTPAPVHELSSADPRPNPAV